MSEVTTSALLKLSSSMPYVVLVGTIVYDLCRLRSAPATAGAQVAPDTAQIPHGEEKSDEGDDEAHDGLTTVRFRWSSRLRPSVRLPKTPRVSPLAEYHGE